MGLSYKQVLLFGDQSVEKLPGIQALVRFSKESPAAKRFLREATDIIQLEFCRLGPQQHGWYKSFDSLLGLAEDYNFATHSNVVVSTVLMCAGRLGQLIAQAEQDPTILGSSSNPVEIVALCGGLLPAAAAVAAKDTSELFALSIYILSVGFRLAVEVFRRAQLVERSSLSWGRTYTGLPANRVQAILDEFHHEKGIPLFRRVTIGVKAENWLTLVGPPSSLEHLASWSPEIRAASSLATDVPGPIHSDVLPQIDSAEIVGNSPLLQQPIDLSKAHMLSPGSLKEYKHSTLGGLLEEVIQDIAHNVLHVTETMQGCVCRLESSSRIKLSVMGPTNHIAAMKQALGIRGIAFQLDQNKAFESKPDEMARAGSDLIAVVGMSGRFPGSDSVDAFWEDLLTGKHQIKEIPKSRFDLDSFFDPTGERKNSTAARHGCFLDEPGMFDHRLFNISPREAAQMDPAHRLLLTISYEALQQAGYSPERSSATIGRSRIATYFGQAADEWQEILNQKGADIYYVPGFSRAFGPARLHYQYKWSGPSYALDSACSTSATAVDLACKALTTRECDMALAGGASVLTTPNTFSGLSRAGMLSTTGGCRTFHDDADGYCRAEGAGVVVLKRVEDARLDNDNILAVIRGSARTYSAAASSMTHPSAESQEDTYNQVLRQSGLSGDEIAYVEMHGTGTQAGDYEEMTSVSTLSRNRTKENPLTVGAVKATVGHGEGASAVTSLIKVILMLRERIIPPQPGGPFKINRKFPPLSKLNIKIPTKQAPLKASTKGDKKIKALVNSFDASGGNVSILVEEPPGRGPKSKDPREWHVVAVSARSAYSLRQNRARLLDYLESHPETKLADLAYTTTARRIHESMRFAYAGSSTGEIMRQLRQDMQIEKETRKPARKSNAPSRAFLFTGQGSQYAGMAADLFRDHSNFRSTLQGYQEVATSMGLPYFLDLISNQGLDISSQATVKTQLAIVTLEIAVASLLKNWGIVPSVVVGHSLGEYAALCISGVLSVSDTIFLVGRRAFLMEKYLTPNTHAMLATNSTQEALETFLEEENLETCSIACCNAPTATVVSGTHRDVETLQHRLATMQSSKTTLLRVPYGFHSGQIDPVLAEYERCAEGVQFATPQVPIASTLTGTIERNAATFGPKYLAQQARQKVSFVQAIKACLNSGLLDENSLWFEIGPDPVCLGLTRQTLGVPTLNLIPTIKSGSSNWRTISTALKRAYESGVSINWTEFHRPLVNSLTLLNLPTYAFDEKDFWTPYQTSNAVVQSLEPDVRNTQKSSPPSADAALLTTTLQRVEQEQIEGSTIKVIFSSQVSEPDLLGAIKGHCVNDQAICPLAIFQDMALSAASFVFSKLHPNSKTPGAEIQNMEMSHAFVLNNTTREKRLYVTAFYRTEDRMVSVHFESGNGSGVTDASHGKCQVAFIDDSPRVWPANLSQTLFLVNSRISSLRDLAFTDKTHCLAKPIIYQLFSNVVSYGPTYQSLQQVILDHTSSDAIGTVKLPITNGLGRFDTNPYWLDAVLHLAGFVLNSGLRFPHETVCLATGFDSWKSAAELVPGETYTSYVCMQEQLGGRGHVISGDCYVFHGDEVVQVTTGIKFLKLKRATLNTILGVSEKYQSVQSTAAWSAAQAPSLSHANHEDNNVKTLSDTATVDNDERLTLSALKQSQVDESEQMIKSMLSIIASESGCTMEDMTDDARYADLGIDSVMAITIFAMLNRNLGVDLPASFFLENETIGDSKTALKSLLIPDSENTTDDEDKPATGSSSSSGAETLSSVSTTKSQSSRDQVENLSQGIECETNKAEYPAQASVMSLPRSLQPPAHLFAQVKHYQGARESGTRKIFFLADESGTTFSYINLPTLGLNLSVFGVDSPFSARKSSPAAMADMKDLLSMDVPTLASIYLAAIRKEQPEGPYILGGISSGAVLALECTRQILIEGHEVLGLFLLDCGQVGGTDAEPATGRLLVKPGQAEHIKNSTTLFRAFVPTPLPSAVVFSLQIQARDEVTKGGALDWSYLVPGLQRRQLDTMRGSFLQTGQINFLGAILTEAVEDAIGQEL